MRWKPDIKVNKWDWHKWFAWYPVEVRVARDWRVHEMVWLETVNRKFEGYNSSGNEVWVYSEVTK